MRSFLVLATAGAGGDLQPLVAAAVGLKQRGHQLSFLGDDVVARAIAPLGIPCAVLPPELDMGRILAGVFQRLGGLSPEQQGRTLRDEIAVWSQDVAARVSPVVEREHPDAIITSLFGIGAADVVATRAGIPWAMVNSTFYVGPNPPRLLSLDFSLRALPIFEYFLPLVDKARLVLHATDQVFDFGYSDLPPKHRYVGPLMWEPESAFPAYVDEPGPPWVLVTVSSQMQDDLPVAKAALDGLAALPIRVLVTTGGSHPIEELGPLPANARAESYVSHAAVLQRSAGFVAHAGHGSVMKALWYGVPMVLVPWGRDQPGVAARAERLGVAKVVPRTELTPERLVAAVRQITSEPSYRESSRRNSARLQQADPVALACDAFQTL